MDPTVLLDQLQEAVNAHDLDGIVACFALDYRNETPAHPMRGFVGRDQVRTTRSGRNGRLQAGDQTASHRQCEV